MADAARLYALKGLVTGAAEGIGEAVARTFVKHGAQVLAVDSRDSRIATAFPKVQGISTLAIDGNDRAANALLVGTVRERLKGLDIVVNNLPSLADAEPSGDPGDPDAFQPWLDRIAETTRSLLPLLKKSPAGRIVNIGALRSTFGQDGEAAFTAAEAALRALTVSQAAEYGGFGITANYIQPGAIMTPVSREVFEADKSFRDFCIARSAAKRLGEPVDVAKVVLFLASDDSVFVSGTGIAVNGGMLPDTA